MRSRYPTLLKAVPRLHSPPPHPQSVAPRQDLGSFPSIENLAVAKV